ncbi:MAG: hypothetical protein DRI46_12735 [Chloroflexi bacterium]|nr:MAG: hypothetical protein DRI46_12735 [Chloroflexota bacterium]
MMMKLTYKPEGYTNDLSLQPPIRKGKIKPELLFLETPTSHADRYRWRFSGNDTETYGLYLFASKPTPGWTLHGSDTFPAGYLTRVQIDPGSTRNLVWSTFQRNSTYNIEIKGVSVYGKHRLTSVMRFRLHTPSAF